MASEADWELITVQSKDVQRRFDVVLYLPPTCWDTTKVGTRGTCASIKSAVCEGSAVVDAGRCRLTRR